MKTKTQKGQLIWREDKSGGGSWYGRFYVLEEGGRVRIARNLQTDNKPLARRRLARLIAQGDPAPKKEDIKTAETFKEAAERIVTENGIKTWSERLSRIRRYVIPHLGHLRIDRVRPPQVKEVLDAAHKAGLEKQSIIHLRNDMSSVFLQLWRDELIPDSPVERVKLPEKMRVDKRPRVILDDEQCAEFFISPEIPDHLRLMAMASRCFGGMRTSDLHAWDWVHIDTETWESAKIYRPKTDDEDGAVELVEREIPDMLVEPLKMWWRRWKKPDDETDGPVSGAVFPVMKGTRAGERQGKRSHARELRNGLWTVGLVRPLRGFEDAYAALKQARGNLATAQRDPDQKGKLRALRAEVKRLDGEARALCSLQSDTERTKRVDFHSFRRAFNTALAKAGTNAQTAMLLAGHRQMATHMRYVIPARLKTPDAALPSPRYPKGTPMPNSSQILPQIVDTDGLEVPVSAHLFHSDPSGNRTRVTGVRGRCPNR